MGRHLLVGWVCSVFYLISTSMLISYYFSFIISLLKLCVKGVLLCFALLSPSKFYDLILFDWIQCCSLSRHYYDHHSCVNLLSFEIACRKLIKFPTTQEYEQFESRICIRMDFELPLWHFPTGWMFISSLFRLFLGNGHRHRLKQLAIPHDSNSCSYCPRHANDTNKSIIHYILQFTYRLYPL